MKARLGFVSNSSSSSYTLIIEDHTLEKVLDKLGDPWRKFVENNGKEVEAFGKKAVQFSYWVTNGGISSWDFWTPEDDGISQDEAEKYLFPSYQPDAFDKLEEEARNWNSKGIFTAVVNF